MAEHLVEIRDLVKTFPLEKSLTGKTLSEVRAVNGLSLEIRPGEILGLVGESGCGKSTVARLLLRLLEADSGQIRFAGNDALAFQGGDLKAFRRDAQMIFQDPYASLNPRMKVRRVLEEPLKVQGWSRSDRQARIAELLELVSLPESALSRHPHEFSGGQCQRIGVARALATRPKLIVADEPVSALDVSIQAQILNLLRKLQRSEELAMLFIAHDLSVVRHISDRIAVMYLGKIVEVAEADELFEHPQHPYTQMLLAAVPTPDPQSRKALDVAEGEPPSPVNPPPGCPFHPRCPEAMDLCARTMPEMADIRPDHPAACHAREPLE